ncbi:MAG: HEAT repeat domain-containing protein [Verrucomicrobiota bacterium]|nr:HEAT repeat domain-containing protein [Verrucomicrobiota bacterium]
MKFSVVQFLFSALIIACKGEAAALPEPVAGWQVEVVAEAPTLRHPSVVACAPDGRVFVAEDPMDISLPEASAAEGRILCLHPDGRITVFAEKLYAVFGLQYLEGKLYVLHNPKFSVFEDDNGIGRNRRELIEQTLPEPSALNWNDHIPANFKLGMDGFFYAACGDKGLYGAEGRDGSRATLSTGGIFRIRPDGTRLEVMSHGVRNILDVALNAEDEQFTYDNTDEHEWMGRFTHMVEAGFYGYPHDFIPRRPYTLWMMEDYGAGAACGALANNEDALPPEYEGNVFLSDFGKRQVMRVQVKREGGSYQAVLKEDLFPNPPGDFRPVGITQSADGKSIYICDWQHRDEKAKVSVGRLLKLTWKGKDHSSPKPEWYLPAAMGKAPEGKAEDFVKGLFHPSRNVRLAAQRELSRSKGMETRKLLIGVVQNASAPALARSHAIWALHEMGDDSVKPVMIAVTRESDSMIRRQAIRQLGLKQVTEAVGALELRLKDEEASVRFQAATALGRIGGAEAVPELVAALKEEDLFARYAAFTALNRIGRKSPSAWEMILQGWESNNDRIIEGTSFAVRETYDGDLLAALVKVFRDKGKNLAMRQRAVELIATLHHQKPEWKGEWWAYHPALQPAPAKTVKWSGTELVLATLQAGLTETNSELRLACIRGLAVAGDRGYSPALREIYPKESNPQVKATILRALGTMKDSEALGMVTMELSRPSNAELTMAAIEAAADIGGEQAAQALSAFLTGPEKNAESLVAAIKGVGKLSVKEGSTAIEPLANHPKGSVRAAALSTLSRLQGDVSVPLLEKALEDGELEVRRAAVKSLSDLKSPKAIPALLKAYSDGALRNDAFAGLARTPDARASDALLDGISSKNPAERNAAHLAIRNISGKMLKAAEARAATLSPQAITELRHIYAGNKTAEAGPLFTREIRQPSAEEYLEAAIKVPGDVVRGKSLFFEANGVNCAACHRVGGEGSDVGPDLSGAGTQFDRRALAEAIIYPSKTVREGYQQITLEMNDDEEFSGVIKGENNGLVTLRDSSGREHKLQRSAIKARRNSNFSLMPEGLHAALSIEEFADLIAYLSSLKSEAK